MGVHGETETKRAGDSHEKLVVTFLSTMFVPSYCRASERGFFFLIKAEAENVYYDWIRKNIVPISKYKFFFLRSKRSLLGFTVHT